ncbi:uncharacterized protein LOC113049161 isoform X1 [Carassius auratus]|uniref:Uncharacterized protein LOC113049161 isoform X1 n=2 Tax=Carassius auratus TaxID=7957 RepID=A0A6P6K478_CARAU|nr:uncharacterized protein LOC113049161 isoform X1 [Carassius auratus]
MLLCLCYSNLHTEVKQCCLVLTYAFDFPAFHLCIFFVCLWWITDFHSLFPALECWQEAMRYLVRFQTGSSVETTDDDKKRKRISNSKYRPQASSDEEESSLPDAPAVLSFGQPLLSFENIVPGNKVSVLPDAPEVASIPENQENVVPSVDFRGEPGFSPEIQTPLHRAKSLSTRHLTGYSPQQFLDERCRARQVLSFTPPAANLPWQHMGENAGGESHRSVIGPWTPLASRVQHEVFSYEDFQRLQNEKQAVMEENQALREENQALREENQALREENQALRESTARAASDDSGSLQEQVKQVGTMLKTFARTGQTGADQTLMLRRLGEFGVKAEKGAAQLRGTHSRPLKPRLTTDIPASLTTGTLSLSCSQ